MSIKSYNDIYTVYAWQDNNRTFTVTTNEGGVKYIRLILKDKQDTLDLSGDEVSVYYAATKPNGKEVLVTANKTDATNGKIEFPIESALTTNHGLVTGEVRVVTPLGVLKFHGINLNVHKGVSDKAAEQTEAFTALIDALRKLAAIQADGSVAVLDDIEEFDLGTNGRLNPMASGVVYEILKRYVLTDRTIAGLSLVENISVEQMQAALKHYPFILFTSEPTTFTKGKVGQFGGLIRYDSITYKFTVKLYLCCSAGKTEGTYQWVLINDNTISDDQIASTLADYLDKHPIEGTGADGEDGVGIGATEINSNGDLVLTYTDGKIENVGKVVGANGKDGIGIKNIKINSNGELVITYTDDKEANVGRIVGADGEDGVDGITPHIGDNGNWFIGDTDTGQPSRGEQGKAGAQGETGEDGYTPVKGVDYYTAEDKAEFQAYIDEKLATGDQTQEVFVDVLVDVGYTEKARINSSGLVKDWENSDVTGYIPVSAGDVIRLKDVYIPNTYNATGDTYGHTAYSYTSDKTYIKSVFLCHMDSGENAALDRIVDDDRVTQFTVAPELFGDNVAYIIIGAADITAESEIYVNSTIVSADKGDIPAYWLAELTAKADTIQRTVETAGRNKSAFLWYTDAHWTSNSKMSPYLLDYLCKNTPINRVNFGGDIIGDPAEFTHNNIKYVYEWRKLISALPNHHSVVGNHDANHNTTDVSKIAYSFLNAPEESSDMVVGGDFYYYIDNPSEKTRYLYLSYLTNDHAKMTAQGKFIVDAIKSAPENWHIVAIAHRWFQYTSSSAPTVGSVPAYEKEILKIFDEYNARTSHTASNYFEAQDFANSKGKVEFCIGGHIHSDYDFETDGGIPVIITTADANQDRVPDSDVDSGTLGTITESAVFCVVADYDNNKINVIGIGRGTSREISY